MKKIFLILIMLITSFTAKPLNGEIEYTNDNPIQNTYTEEIIVLEEKTSDEEIIESEQEEIVVDTKPIEIENIIETKNINAEHVEPVVIEKTNKNSANLIPENVQEQVKDEIVEKPCSQPIEEQFVEQQVIENTPKQEEKIYCVDGGKIHIYGDGANEHGYYKTWDEAFKAYEDYTKGWESTQFKVD